MHLKKLLLLIIGQISFLSASEIQMSDLMKMSNEHPDKELIFKSLAYFSGGGTGVFISPYHVLTSYSVVANKNECQSKRIETEMIASDKPRPRGRSIFCSDVIFADKALQASLIVTDKAVKTFLPLTREDLITEKHKIFSLGYHELAFVSYSYDCQVIQKNPSNSLIYGPGGEELSLKDFFLTDCLFNSGVSGSPLFNFDVDLKRPVLIGIFNFLKEYSHSSGLVTTAATRFTDLLKKYPDEFEEVFDYSAIRWK